MSNVFVQWPVQYQGNTEILHWCPQWDARELKKHMHVEKICGTMTKRRIYTLLFAPTLWSIRASTSSITDFRLYVYTHIYILKRWQSKTGDRTEWLFGYSVKKKVCAVDKKAVTLQPNSVVPKIILSNQETKYTSGNIYCDVCQRCLSWVKRCTSGWISWSDASPHTQTWWQDVLK